MKPPTHLPALRREHGLSYVEVLISVVLIALMLVPALEALRTGVLAADIHGSHTLAHHQLTAKLEEVLAEPFVALDAAATAAGSPSVPTSYSDSAGASQRRLVFLSRYDGDNADGDDDPFTGTDEDLLWVRVEIETTTLAVDTLTAR